jgi:N-acetylglucosaminyldiphosphoundecaprenol N-acetyl-beta-D-mannosaminyltransferase
MLNKLESLKQAIKSNWDALVVAVLWLLIWATYNTDITRIFTPGWPHGGLDFVHGLRSLFPFISFMVASVWLINNLRKKTLRWNFFFGPLGFLMLYALVGVLASIFSQNVWLSLYWGVLYFFTMVVLLMVMAQDKAKKYLTLILYINFIIATLIVVVLTFAFFAKSGSFSFLTVLQFLQGKRPYEGINNLGAEVLTLGMAGTRPTGLGRYAGFAVILFFVYLLRSSKKTFWLPFISFITFLTVLIFTRARTSVVAVLGGLLLVSFLKSKSKINYLIISATFLMLLWGIGFFPVFFSYINNESLLSKKNTIDLINSKKLNLEEKDILSKNLVSMLPADEKLNTVVTLSGRTTGIWPAAWHLFLQSPVVGFGFFADRIFLEGHHAHNLVLEALVQSGALGTGFFLISLLMAWYLALSFFKKQPDDIWLVLSIGFLTYFTLRGITESFVFFGADYLLMVPIFAYLQLRYQEKPQSQRAQMKVLGNKVDVIEIPETINLMGSWIKDQSKKACWIVVTGMHGIMESQKNIELQEKLNSADLFVPDGISLVWIAKLKGLTIKDRVSGADLMRAFFVEAEKNGWSSFFYGDSKDTLEKLQQKLLAQFPRLKIVGSYDSHYKPLFSDEDSVVINLINEKKPDVVWVGRGMPKQEHWIYQYRSQLQVPVVVGVGAAFKFLSGKVSRAPKWVGALGFEWLWRLFTEPKTTFTRVFIDAPKFVTLVALELLKDFFS